MPHLIVDTSHFPNHHLCEPCSYCHNWEKKSIRSIWLKTLSLGIIWSCSRSVRSLLCLQHCSLRGTSPCDKPVRLHQRVKFHILNIFFSGLLEFCLLCYCLVGHIPPCFAISDLRKYQIWGKIWNITPEIKYQTWEKISYLRNNKIYII